MPEENVEFGGQKMVGKNESRIDCQKSRNIGI
jgi:hypothetical protein